LNVLERDSVASLERLAFVVTADHKKHKHLLADLKESDATDQVVVFRDAEED
jgi:putative Mg2+ transporter-C (MgtC) family protein